MDGMYILKTFTSWYSIGLNRLLSSENYRSDSDTSDVFDDLKDYTLNEKKTLWIDRSTCQISESLVPLTEDEPTDETSIDAFLGIVEVMNTYHLGVVTKSEIVAELDLGNLGFNKNGNSRVMMIREVKFLPIRCHPEVIHSGDMFDFDAALNQAKPSTSPGANITADNSLSNLATVMNSVNTLDDLGQYQMQEEVLKIIENMEKILSTGYYYSYDTDLTNTLQSQYLERRVPLRSMLESSGKTENVEEHDLLSSSDRLGGSTGRTDRPSRTNLHKHNRYDDKKEKVVGRNELMDEMMERNKALYCMSKRDFNWGYKMSHVVPKRWKTVLIQGYVGYRIIHVKREKIEVLIIGRRSIKRSGTRFVARGIDEHGNVGNFVESEVRIRINHESWYSYTQHRGSVPVFWEQLSLTSPVMLYNYHHNIRSFNKHVKILKEYYEPCDYQLYVNLLDVKENEKVLTDSFMNVVDDYNSSIGFKSTIGVKALKDKGLSSSRFDVEGKSLSEIAHGRSYESLRKYGSGVNRPGKGMIDLVTYNYNVNAKWSTHEIIVKYILEELNDQFNDIGYFNEEAYLENAPKDENEYVGSFNLSSKSSRVSSSSQGSDSDILSSRNESSSEELDQILREKEGVGVDLLVTEEYNKDDLRVSEYSDQDRYRSPKSRSGKRAVGSSHATDDSSSGSKIDENKWDGIGGLQRGILRTNCLDCLDRTNIFQWISSWVVLNKILNNRMTSSTGGTSILKIGEGVNLLEESNTTDVDFKRLKEMLLTPEGVIREENALFTSFTDLWCDHGDNMSIHYSGTQSTLSERAKQTNTSLNSIFHYSKTMVQRFYNSMFQDGQRQTVFNILTPYTLTGSGVSQREQDELLLLDPEDREGRHVSRASGVASRVAQKVDQVVRGARERRLLNTKYYIQDPFDAEESGSGPGAYTAGHDRSELTRRGFEVPYSSDSESHTGSSRAQLDGASVSSKRPGGVERFQQQVAPKEESEGIFERLQKEIMNKLTIKSPILASTDSGTKGIPDLKLLKQQREQLEEEYEELEDREREENLLKTEYTRRSVDQLKIWIGSWNIGAHSIDVNQNVLQWMELRKTECDLYVFSFQEFVELNFINIATGRTDENKEYEFEYFIENMFKLSTTQGYEKVTSISMTGLYLVIFVKRSLKPHIRDLLITNVKTGLNYNIGNKGSVGIQFNIFDYTVSFLNIHLNFGKNLNVGRIELLEYILKNAFKEFNKNVLDNDIFILGGDFNFHVQLEKQVVLNLLKKMDYAKLLNYDEFNMAKMIGIPVLNKLHEANIQFQPTYKYKDGTKYYTTKRSPAWCDRIIVGGKLFESKKINILSYKRNDNLMISDHRPVSSIIVVDLK